MTTQIEKALFRLNEFCLTNSIDYVLTGTVVLHKMGLCPDYQPKDIYILVYGSDQVIKTLDTLQKLSGCENSNYPDCACYTFKVNDIKVNVITYKSSDKWTELIKNKTMDMIWDDGYGPTCVIKVHKPYAALKAKAKLKRPKDYQYMANLIHEISGLL